VLDGVHHLRTSAELSAALAPAYLAHVRANRWQSRTISPPKDNALLRWRWLKGDPAFDTEVQANALERHRPG
jgi:hypothetical protein